MGIADELERVQALRERGALSADEYECAKAEQTTRPDHSAGIDSGTDAGTGTEGRSGTPFLQRLARSRYDRYLGGVCGGLGRHTDLPPWAWRVIFCVVTIYFGAGILFYVLLWLFLPLES